MFQSIRKKMGQEGGFTLIELLIVVIVLAVLAAIVVFAVGGFAARGKKSACRTDYRSVQTAQEAHKADKGFYADNVAALTTSTPKYIQEVPSTTSGYTITTNNTGQVTVLVTTPARQSAEECEEIT